MKAAARPFVNVATAGAGAPVASTAEDIFSVAMSFVAIMFPVLIIFFLIFLIWFFVAMRTRRSANERRKEELEAFRRAAQEPGTVDVPRDPTSVAKIRTIMAGERTNGADHVRRDMIGQP